MDLNAYDVIVLMGLMAIPWMCYLAFIHEQIQEKRKNDKNGKIRRD